MGGQHPCRGHGFCPSLLPSSWHWDEGKYLDNGRAQLASDRAGSLSEAGINLKEFTGGVCGGENSLLISHSYGHLLRTVCSVSNSLIKINIKQIENIPRRGCLICWRILQQTSQSTQKTPDHGKRPGRTLDCAWATSLGLGPGGPGAFQLHHRGGVDVPSPSLSGFPSRCGHPSSAWRGGRRRVVEAQPLAELIRGLLQQTSKLQLTGAACDPLAEPR